MFLLLYILDIFYAYANEGKTKSGIVLNERQKAKFLDINHNKGDWLLYQHFNRTLWQKISEQTDFYEEVGTLGCSNTLIPDQPLIKTSAKRFKL